MKYCHEYFPFKGKIRYTDRLESTDGAYYLKTSTDNSLCAKGSEDWAFKLFSFQKRLENEIKALEFLATENKIPAPEIISKCDTGDHCCLATKEIKGVEIHQLEHKEDIRAVCAEVGEIYDRMKSLLRPKAESFSGELCLFASAGQFLHHNKVKQFAPSEEDVYPLCHGDLYQSNIIVDPTTARVKGIIDWEFAGFYPLALDPPRFCFEIDHREGANKKLMRESASWSSQSHHDFGEEIQAFLSNVKKGVYYPSGSANTI
ncbi:kinase-like protein [Meira miltonrushii]|uniref:Kinase-like protein n=1 Tax=Meira miltonrushii TaxID=1280837 RepID=A0A316V8J7_9BASI|nr:kinase-like protein [Meira miltonrushii]PWN33810.1 kinase-like protein [Meira miltonrushii]